MSDISAEPSMEEILSSIKRIIAEEEAPTGRRRAAARAPASPEPSEVDDGASHDEVLELSDPILSAPSPPVAAQPSMPRFRRADDDDAPPPVSQAEPTPPIAAEPPVDREPAPHPAMPADQPADSTPESIVSPAAVEATRGALASLSKLAAKSDAPDATGDGPLEHVVREMLRPMLRQWLDTHLPDMVEAMVSREIARISGQHQ